MTEVEFKRLAAQGFNRIPLVLETFADLDTPLSVYLKLANKPYSYLLESVQGGERFGRYSFIGLASSTRINVHGRTVLVLSGNRVAERSDEGDPLEFINAYLQRFKVAALPGLPRFCGGLVGCFGYDTVRYIEPRLGPSAPPDTLGTPDILLMLSEELAIVDNLSGKLTLVVYAEPEVPGAYQKARARLGELLVALRAPVGIPEETPQPAEQAQSTFGEAGFKAAVERAKRYIHDGDVMQVVLSQRLSLPFAARPLALYRALRTLNPSPYMFYFDFDDFYVVGASPEILVRLEGGKVTLRPIAGTRPRGHSDEEDRRLEEELLADPKEAAEHVMLVDLARNDLGRVAVPGTIRVDPFRIIERYSHVMHIVSGVNGVLAPEADAFDLFAAAFPAGTVVGAPKVRAMELIDELEPVGRGLYAGTVGYFGHGGGMDQAIAIRTLVFHEGTYTFQAGAGIVADSRAEAELAEVRAKAAALEAAMTMAEDGL
jgi:anthranilate synthase component 1